METNALPDRGIREASLVEHGKQWDRNNTGQLINKLQSRADDIGNSCLCVRGWAEVAVHDALAARQQRPHQRRLEKHLSETQRRRAPAKPRCKQQQQQ